MWKLSIVLSFIFPLCFAEIYGELIEFDLGTVSNQNIVEREFEFAGEIKNVISLCECLEISTHKKELSFKGYPVTSIVNIIFDPKDYVGETTHDIILVDTQDKVTKLRIKAVVSPKIKK